MCGAAGLLLFRHLPCPQAEMQPDMHSDEPKVSTVAYESWKDRLCVCDHQQGTASWLWETPSLNTVHQASRVPGQSAFGAACRIQNPGVVVA